MEVGKNLADALRALRDWHDGHDAYNWIDAICIDQSNFRERAYQVSIMGEIFGSANDVFIWLGEEAQDSNLALNFIKILAKCYQRLEERREKVLALAQDVRYQPHWAALDKLWKRRWWDRAWVLQETVLACKAVFCCGQATISLEDMFSHALLLRLAWDEIYDTLERSYGIKMRIPTYHTLDGINRIRSARLAGIIMPMMTCHFRTMSSSVTDRRDAIFSKLGMASDGYIVKPSYTDPIEAVYSQYVQDHINTTRSLDIITMDTRPRVTPGIPTWVPDWISRFAASPLQRDHGGDPRVGFRYYSASGNRPALAHFDASDPAARLLSCQGYAFDIVDGVSHAEDNSWSGVSDPSPVSQPRSGRCAYKDDDAVLEALWRSVTINQRADGGLPDAAYGGTLAASFVAAEGRPNSVSLFDRHCARIGPFELFGETVSKRMARAVAAGGPLPPPTSSSPITLTIMENWVGTALTFHRLLTTEAGWAGIGSCDVAPGDVVAILFGCSVSMVLRPLPSGSYRVLGEAYIHGIMYGEALDDLMSKNPQPETFNLV